MKKIILTYGIISGAVSIGVMIFTMTIAEGEVELSGMQWLGYLTMILALSLVFIGIKKYRDIEQGGVIRFGRAFIVGLGITLVASVVYVVIWEINLALTDYAFIDNYAESVISARQAEGATEAEMADVIAMTEQAKARLGNPVFRVLITFTEIFPVGLLISLISAALLRKNELLPANPNPSKFTR